jgi:hypothetical protein
MGEPIDFESTTSTGEAFDRDGFEAYRRRLAAEATSAHQIQVNRIGLTKCSDPEAYWLRSPAFGQIVANRPLHLYDIMPDSLREIFEKAAMERARGARRRESLKLFDTLER